MADSHAGQLSPARPLPTILVLDFHDSYTRNVLSLVQQVVLGKLGGTGEAEGESRWIAEGRERRVVVVNVDSLSWDSFLTTLLPHLDCVILGPGPGTPHNSSDFSWPHRLIEELGDQLPIFGLCLGCQGLATVFGGKVVKAAAPKHGQVSLIRLASPPSSASSSSSSLFSDVAPTFSAVQYNSLVVDPESLPSELEVLAWTKGADGRDEVMALRHEERPLYGVQFHPESIESTYGARIIGNFFSLALSFHSFSSPTSQTSKPDLPSHILALSTSYRPRPSLPRISRQDKRWEQRSVVLDDVAEGWTPQKVFERLVKGKSRLGEVWLDSARPTAELQHSHVFVPQAVWSYSVARDSFTLRSSTSSSASSSISTSTHPLSSLPQADFFDLLTASHSHLQRHTRFPPPSSAQAVPLGFVGSIGYEMKDVSMPLSRRRCTDEEMAKEQEEGRSDCELAIATTVLSFEHETGRWTASGLVRLNPAQAKEEDTVGALVDDLGVSGEEWTAWLSTVHAALSSPPPASPAPSALSTSFTPVQSRPDYLSSIRAGQSLIRSGDTYELCLTTAFEGDLPADSPLVEDPYPAYLALRASNPAPYGAYFHLPSAGKDGEGLAILSSSPERFLRITASPSSSSSTSAVDATAAPVLRACMKPIKGTARRSSDPVEDARRRDALEADAKERAENLMIVDLIRNDLLACCDVGSVQVEGLMKVETYETVHQLVTTVTGTLSPGVSPVEAVKASFPPGSMTGAPKLRSVQLLDELEGEKRRGVYSGIFGYLSLTGASDWSVVIRTLVKRGRHLSLGAGGAITHLSDPEQEWAEVLTKVDAVLGGLGSKVEAE
ncbi:hypothetical protein JCM8097_000308 [Rhodosporidiobolus ruineniae]